MVLEPGKIACHLEGSRASSLVTGVLIVSLCSDFIGDRLTLVRGDISIKRVHWVSYVLVSAVSVRRELVFPYVSIVVIK